LRLEKVTLFLGNEIKVFMMLLEMDTAENWFRKAVLFFLWLELKHGFIILDQSFQYAATNMKGSPASLSKDYNWFLKLSPLLSLSFKTLYFFTLIITLDTEPI